MLIGGAFFGDPMTLNGKNVTPAQAATAISTNMANLRRKVVFLRFDSRREADEAVFKRAVSAGALLGLFGLLGVAGILALVAG